MIIIRTFLWQSLLWNDGLTSCNSQPQLEPIIVVGAGLIVLVVHNDGVDLDLCHIRSLW